MMSKFTAWTYGMLAGGIGLALGCSAYAEETAAPVLPAAAAQQANPGGAGNEPDNVKPLEKREFSYGHSDLSILFLPAQMERMKSAIRSYESALHDKPLAPTPAPIPEPAKPVNTEEPKLYPVFYLASIAYDAPGDWSIWMSGRKITSKKNETDVSVLSIDRDSVTFLWRPSFSRTLTQRHNEAAFASVETVKNKLASSQAIQLNEETGSVRFTLRQNQSFAVGYFKIFEGFIETPTIPPIMSGVDPQGADLQIPPPEQEIPME